MISYSNAAISDSAPVAPNVRKRKAVQTEHHILRLVYIFFNDRIMIFSSCYIIPHSPQYKPLRYIFN